MDLLFIFPSRLLHEAVSPDKLWILHLKKRVLGEITWNRGRVHGDHFSPSPSPFSLHHLRISHKSFSLRITFQWHVYIHHSVSVKSICENGGRECDPKIMMQCSGNNKCIAVDWLVTWNVGLWLLLMTLKNDHIGYFCYT